MYVTFTVHRQLIEGAGYLFSIIDFHLIDSSYRAYCFAFNLKASVKNDPCLLATWGLQLRVSQFTVTSLHEAINVEYS